MAGGVAPVAEAGAGAFNAARSLPWRGFLADQRGGINFGNLFRNLGGNGEIGVIRISDEGTEIAVAGRSEYGYHSDLSKAAFGDRTSLTDKRIGISMVHPKMIAVQDSSTGYRPELADVDTIKNAILKSPLNTGDLRIIQIRVFPSQDPGTTGTNVIIHVDH
jgi:hypothetical protein